MNISEVACDVVSQFKDIISSQNNSRYGGVTYIPILSDGSIAVSLSPSCLYGQQECILIMCVFKKAQYNEYPHYTICYIDKECNAHKGFEVDGCSIQLTKANHVSDDLIIVSKFGRGVYIEKPFQTWDKIFPKVWEIYKAISLCKTRDEVNLISSIKDKKDELNSLKQIGVEAVLLKKERDQYKSMLDEIKKMVEQHNINNK